MRVVFHMHTGVLNLYQPTYPVVSVEGSRCEGCLSYAYRGS